MDSMNFSPRIRTKFARLGRMAMSPMRTFPRKAQGVNDDAEKEMPKKAPVSKSRSKASVMSSAVQFQNSNLFNLHGRIALVSGGGTGIGLMIARGLAANGAKVYIGGRRKEVLETVAAEWSAQGKGTLIPYVRLETWFPGISTDKQ
jgi:hypothetical protein